MEISPPVLISSSNPTAAARISELSGLSCSAPSQVQGQRLLQKRGLTRGKLQKRVAFLAALLPSSRLSELLAVIKQLEGEKGYSGLHFQRDAVSPL